MIALEHRAPEPAQRPSSRRNHLFPVGVDLYPACEERAAFSDWYSWDFEKEMARIASLHLSLVRVFVSWRLFEPEVGRYDEEVLDRLGALLACAHSFGLETIVAFFADDRIAEMNDVAWAKRRDPRTDSYLIQRQIAHVQRVVGRYRGEAAVWAWQLGNQAFFAGFESAEALEKWSGILQEAIKEADPSRPVMLGADVEALMHEAGVDARTAVDGSDHALSGVTEPYLSYGAGVPLTREPATFVGSFLLRCGMRGLPVMADGIGARPPDCSLEEEAAYVRTALHSALMNGASGAMLASWRDAVTEKREPYWRDPYEVILGLNDSQGEPKPVSEEVRRFVDLVARLDLNKFRPIAERTAVLIPSERFEPAPSVAGLHGPRACLQAYKTAKEAHLPVAIVHEGGRLDDFQALFVPSAAKLAATTWRKLASLVRAGGSVVCSYGGGDVDPAVLEVFGVDFLGEDGPRPSVRCRVAQPGLISGLAAFDASLRVPHYALVSAVSATVVAADDTGRPLLTINQYGRGSAVFISGCLERALASEDRSAASATVQSFLRAVYGQIARAAGAGPMLECDDPAVEMAVFSGGAEDVVIALNHAEKERTAVFTSSRLVASVSDMHSGEVAEIGARSFGVPIGPNGAAALRLTYA